MLSFSTRGEVGGAVGIGGCRRVAGAGEGGIEQTAKAGCYDRWFRLGERAGKWGGARETACT